MNKQTKVALAALIVGCGFAFASTTASAEIACNGAGDCWHVHGDYTFHPDFGVVIHPDNGLGRRANITDGVNMRAAGIGMAIPGESSELSIWLSGRIFL